MRLSLLLAATLLLATLASAPAATASDTCTTATGCLDTCNHTFCVRPLVEPQDVVDAAEGALCGLQVCL